MNEEQQLTVFELVKKVIPCIASKQYSTDYQVGLIHVFNCLLAYCKEHGEEYFSTELAQRFLFERYGVQPGTVDRSHSRHIRAMDLLSDYQHFGTVMIRRRAERVFPEGLRSVTEEYLHQMLLNGRRQNTIKNHRKVLLRFTDYLDSVGVRDYRSLSLDIINQFIKVVFCNYSNVVSVQYHSILRRFLHYLAQSGNSCEDFSTRMISIKRFPQSARIPTTLTLEQINKILASVDRESPQGKRDYAVLLIAVKLGLRSCDIRRLKPSDIDWDQHIISFTQIKTNLPLSLPMPTDVGWAIIDYLKNGRPVSSSPEIFLRAVAPYEPLQNFDNILIKHMQKAGIPLDSIKHHGLHSLRHSLATHMLDENIPITTIQEVLGQIRAESTQKYIGINIRQLRLCALEVTD